MKSKLLKSAIPSFLLAASVLCSPASMAEHHMEGSAALEADMEMLVDKIKADKKLLVASNMDLTDAEAAFFWPKYDEFQRILEDQNQQVGLLILDYANAYNTGEMSDDQAMSMLERSIDLDLRAAQHRKAFAQSLATGLPARQVARYMQIENKIRAVLRLELAAQIPLVY